MKLHADARTTRNTVTAYGPGFVEINESRYQGHVWFTPDSPVQAWATAGFEALRVEDFEPLLAQQPQIVLLGTGQRQRFPQPRLLAALTRAGIGVEAMDTAAACRTYNIVMAEGRRVLAAFLLED